MTSAEQMVFTFCCDDNPTLWAGGEPWTKEVALIDRVIRETERKVWRKVRVYQARRITLAASSRCFDVLEGNFVNEAMESGAIAELRGLDLWLNEQAAQGETKPTGGMS